VSLDADRAAALALVQLELSVDRWIVLCEGLKASVLAEAILCAAPPAGQREADRRAAACRLKLHHELEELAAYLVRPEVRHLVDGSDEPS
jgi:hypothetical protein